MPSVSGPQHRAMEAAAHGHSTLGIPKSVGQDFSNADKGKKFAKGGTVKPDDYSAMDAALKEFGKTRQGPPPPKPPPKPPIKTSENEEDSDGQGYNMGGEIGSVPTIGTASSYPPPPGQRKQGPRNYGKKE